MQNDWALQAARVIKYPWVSRIDRTIYQQHPELDPVGLARKCLLAGITGYWVSRFMKWNRYIGTSIAVLPFAAKFLSDQWRLSKELKPYGTIDFKEGPRLQLKISEYKQQGQKNSQNEPQHRFKNIRKMPFLQSPILNAKDFTDNLSPNYYK